MDRLSVHTPLPLGSSSDTTSQKKKKTGGDDSTAPMGPDVPAGMHASGADRLRDKLGSFFKRTKKTEDGINSTSKRVKKGKRNEPGPSVRKTETPEDNVGQDETRSPVEVPHFPYVSYAESSARFNAINTEPAPIPRAGIAMGSGAQSSSTKDPGQTVVRDSREETPRVSPIVRPPFTPFVPREAPHVVIRGPEARRFQQSTRRRDSGYIETIPEEKDYDDLRSDISDEDHDDLYSSDREPRGAPAGRPFGVRGPEREPEQAPASEQTLPDDRWQRHDPDHSDGSIAGGIDSQDEPRTQSQNEENFKRFMETLSPEDKQRVKEWADQESKIDPTRPVGPNFNPWTRNNTGGGGPNNPGGGGSNPGGDDFLNQMRASQNQNMQQEFEMQNMNMMQQQFSTFMGMQVQQCSASCNAVLQGANAADELEETADRNAAKLAGG